MASFNYLIRTSKRDSNADVAIRIHFADCPNGQPRIDSYAPSGIKLPKRAWDKMRGAIKTMYTSTANPQNADRAYSKAQDDLDRLKKHVFDAYNMLAGAPTSTKWLTEVVAEFWEQRREAAEAQRRAKEQEKYRENLNQYIGRYIKEISSGERLTNRNTKYKFSTVKAVKASMAQFAAYQRAARTKFDFDDITMDFYRKYTNWLARKGYTINSIGKCIKDLKNILANAQEDGLHETEEYKRRKFKVTAEEADNIYLTREELAAIAAVDLSKLSKGYSDARDLFLAGCWLAQRISDYNHLSPSNIETRIEQVVVDGQVVAQERIYINLIQQKTSVRVIIPANKELRELLAKYDNRLPYISDQKLNKYIKEIAMMAGITEEVEITSTRGGEHNKELIPKCMMVKSHTARRTGATLMYLSGMDAYDICRITGHSSITTLRRYLKADELDVATKISKYDYFE